MDQRLTAILLRNNLEQAQAFFERLGFGRKESPDDYRMASEGSAGMFTLRQVATRWA